MTESSKIKQFANPLKTPWQQRNIGLEVHHPDIQAMATAATRWAKAWHSCDRQYPRLLVVCGGVGVGKSHCLRAIHAWCRGWPDAWPHTPTSTLHHFPKLVDHLREFPSAECELKADTLFLDDIGAEDDPYRSGMPAKLLGQILGDRERKWTFITSNISILDMMNRYDARVADRMFRNSTIVQMFDVPSYATR